MPLMHTHIHVHVPTTSERRRRRMYHTADRVGTIDFGFLTDWLTWYWTLFSRQKNQGRLKGTKKRQAGWQGIDVDRQYYYDSTRVI